MSSPHKNGPHPHPFIYLSKPTIAQHSILNDCHLYLIHFPYKEYLFRSSQVRQSLQLQTKLFLLLRHRIDKKHFNCHTPQQRHRITTHLISGHFLCIEAMVHRRRIPGGKHCGSQTKPTQIRSRRSPSYEGVSLVEHSKSIPWLGKKLNFSLLFFFLITKRVPLYFFHDLYYNSCYFLHICGLVCYRTPLHMATCTKTPLLTWETPHFVALWSRLCR